MSEFIPYFKAKTLDDLVLESFESIFKHGLSVSPTKGPSRELQGVTLELTNPRARLSQSFTRGKVFSALGELCWYLSGSNDGRFMDYYIRKYAENNADDPSSEACVVNGAYGPRLFHPSQSSQFDIVRDILVKKPATRQAVLQLFDREDIAEWHRDIPCTCILQFILRDGKLNLIVYMRSNDVFKGLIHDFFAFTMIQEIMARSLNKELGTYKHVVGSFHLYDKDELLARQFVQEGYQSTSMAMPPMPEGHQWDEIKHFLQMEQELRIGIESQSNCTTPDPYWADLVILLQAYKRIKDDPASQMLDLSDSLTNSIYKPYIIQRANWDKQPKGELL